MTLDLLAAALFPYDRPPESPPPGADPAATAPDAAASFWALLWRALRPPPKAAPDEAA